MIDPEIHSLEVKEAVLHDRLCRHRKVRLPYTICLSPGRMNLADDVCSYDVLSHDQALVSLGKINFKRFCRAYAGLWRQHNVKVDLAIGMNPPIGTRQQYMLASMPAFHAQRLERQFCMMLDATSDVANLYSEDFDPYILLGLRPSLTALET